jgi:polysaccharide pyruvyl transferase WcaK-like protein
VRVVFANDYSSINHCGSKLLNASLKRTLRRWADLVAIPHDELLAGKWARAVDACDALVINGEGNFHRGNPVKLGQIVELAARGRARGKRVALVNSVAAELPEGLPLDAFDYVSVRESASAHCLSQLGYRGELAVVPDATFLAEPRARAAPRRELILVTDCVSAETTRALRDLGSELRRRGFDVGWAPFERGMLPRVSARRTLARFARARLVVSGRFHGNCFAMITGTPVVSVDSNTHKTRALMADLGLERLHFASVEALARFLRDAVAAPGAVPSVPAADVPLARWRAAIEASLRAAIGREARATV